MIAHGLIVVKEDHTHTPRLYRYVYAMMKWLSKIRKCLEVVVLSIDKSKTNIDTGPPPGHEFACTDMPLRIPATLAIYGPEAYSSGPELKLGKVYGQELALV